MKLASVSIRTTALVLVLAGASLSSAPARAETAEARSAAMLRDRPAANGRVVERVPSGTKLQLLEMGEDGAWALVRTKTGREGWIPVASIRTRGGGAPTVGDADDGGGAGRDEDDAAIAKRRNVRPEAWVSKSKYHDDDNKMTVVASKAELYGRPQASGTILGIVRRGEVVQFVRRSADKKWVQIDIGAGELAWVDAKAVRMGSDMARANEEPPDEAPPPRRAAREERDDPPPPRRRTDETPPPPRRRTDETPPPPSRRHTDEPSPEDLRRADRDRDEEPPPGMTRRPPQREAPPEDEPPPRRRERDRDRDRDREEAQSEEPPRRRRRSEPEAEARPGRPKKPPHGNNYFELHVRFGLASSAERVRTNGLATTLLTNYQYGNTNLGVGLALGYARAIGRLRLHIDAKYLLAAAGGVQYRPTPAAVPSILPVLDQNLGFGVAVGGFFDVAGGIDLRLRLGADIWVNQIAGSNAPLAISSDIVLAMAIGIEFGMPEVLYLAKRPLGFRIKGGALAPGNRMQQPNLHTAVDNSTLGGYAGLSVHYGLLTNVARGQLHLEIAYDFSIAVSHFSGACPPTTSEAARFCRDDTVDDANYSSATHVATIGLYYQY